MMEKVFKYELDEREIENINEFCKSIDYCAIEQCLGWTQIFKDSKICYFYLKDDSVIRSFCQIHEKFRSAHIIFGPACCDKEIMVASINEIIHFYKKRHFIYLGIQMYYKSSFETEYIEYKLNKLHRIKYLFNTDNTKSSIEINLENSLELIYNGFRKGHKSDIKKAVKLGLTVNPAKDTAELLSFTEIYLKMCRVRGIIDNQISPEKIQPLYNYLKSNNLGEILIIKESSGDVLGGAVIVFQGVSVRYLKGATDPARRDMPILHLLMHEAIRMAKNRNFKYFDFWGFNHFVDEDNQVYNINHFKKGFGGYYTFLAKRMNINLVPKGFLIHTYLMHLKNIFKKLSLN